LDDLAHRGDAECLIQRGSGTRSFDPSMIFTEGTPTGRLNGEKLRHPSRATGGRGSSWGHG
jgi:hypothetical protein